MPQSNAAAAVEFNQFTGTDGYIVSAPLVEAVNCAIALERPLLIKGEPGTGKTLLALHVAQGQAERSTPLGMACFTPSDHSTTT